VLSWGDDDNPEQSTAALISFANRGDENENGGMAVIRKVTKTSTDRLEALMALYDDEEDDVRRIMSEFLCCRVLCQVTVKADWKCRLARRKGNN